MNTLCRHPCREKPAAWRRRRRVLSAPRCRTSRAFPSGCQPAVVRAKPGSTCTGSMGARWRSSSLPSLSRTLHSAPDHEVPSATPIDTTPQPGYIRLLSPAHHPRKGWSTDGAQRRAARAKPCPAGGQGNNRHDLRQPSRAPSPRLTSLTSPTRQRRSEWCSALRAAPGAAGRDNCAEGAEPSGRAGSGQDSSFFGRRSQAGPSASLG
jgi:hypothetical protein